MAGYWRFRYGQDRQPYKETLVNKYTGESVHIAGASPESLSNKKNKQLEIWEKAHRLVVFQETVNERTAEMKAKKESLRTFGTRPGAFTAARYYKSLEKVYTEGTYVSKLEKPEYVKPKLVFAKRKRRPLLEFFFKKLKEKRLAEEQKTIELNEENELKAKDKYKNDIEEYNRNLKIEREKFDRDELRRHLDIRTFNDSLLSREGKFNEGNIDEINAVIDAYFKIVYYASPLKDQMSNAKCVYDPSFNKLFIERYLNLDEYLPREKEFKYGPKKGVFATFISASDFNKMRENTVKSILCRTVYDLFHIIEEKRLNEIDCRCFYDFNGEVKLVGKCATFRSKVQNISEFYKEIDECVDMNGLKNVAKAETREDILDDLSDDFINELYDKTQKSYLE